MGVLNRVYAHAALALSSTVVHTNTTYTSYSVRMKAETLIFEEVKKKEKKKKKAVRVSSLWQHTGLCKY